MVRDARVVTHNDDMKKHGAYIKTWVGERVPQDDDDNNYKSGGQPRGGGGGGPRGQRRLCQLPNLTSRLSTLPSRRGRGPDMRWAPWGRVRTWPRVVSSG